MDDYSLEDFIEAVDILCDSDSELKKPKEKLFIKTPPVECESFQSFPLWMKNSPQSRGYDCKSCKITRKQLECRMEKMEFLLNSHYEQLFESYSHLLAQIKILQAYKDGHEKKCG